MAVTPRPGAVKPPAPSPAAAGAPSPGPEALDTVLRELIAAHEELLTLASAQRSAIQRADVRALADIAAAQGAVMERVVDLERRRQTVVASLASGIKGKVTVTQLARLIADPARSRLTALADRLRELLNRLHQEHMALRAAAETLGAHMEGLMRQVCRKLSHAGTYARSGAIESGGAVVTALDVRT
jgi:hypothetical protein